MNDPSQMQPLPPELQAPQQPVLQVPTTTIASPQPLGISPENYQRFLIQNAREQGGLAAQNYEQQGEAAAQKAAAYQAKAVEDKQAADDFMQAHQLHIGKMQEMQKHTLQSFNDWKGSTKDVRDPSAQFWGDKGTHARILSGFAAFASGLGAGLLGSATNPYLEMLQKEKDRNFEAHRAHINDLYQQHVASGKIEDSAEARANFDQEARLRHNALANEKIKDDMGYIEANSNNQTSKLLAKKTIADLDAQTAALQNAWAQRQAQMTAMNAQQQRAEINRVRADGEKANAEYLDLLKQNVDPNEAAKQVKALHPEATHLGFFAPAGSTVSGDNQNQKEITPQVDNGIKAGAGIIPPKPGEKPEPVLVEGEQRVPVNKLAGEQWQKFSDSYQNIKDNRVKLLKSWEEGNKGAYEQARAALMEELPKLYSFTRGPSEGQLGGVSGERPGTVSEQIPEYGVLTRSNLGLGGYGKGGGTGSFAAPRVINDQKLAAFSSDLDKHIQNAIKATFLPPKQQAISVKTPKELGATK